MCIATFALLRAHIDTPCADPLTPCSESTSFSPAADYHTCCGITDLRLFRLFYGHWPDKNGRGLTTLIVEQVSHHPPITAYHISNESRKITLQGHSAQKTSFSGELFALWRYASNNVHYYCRREHYREAGRARHLDCHAPRWPERDLPDHTPTPRHRGTLVRLALHRAFRNVLHPMFIWLAVHDQVSGQGLLFRQVTHVQGDTHTAHRRGLRHAGEQL